jgi:DNA repair protein RecO (recombination protein O)
MTKTIKTKVLILSSIRWKESSKIVTLYSEKLGKIKVIARGALKNNSAFAGKLQSLQLSEAIILVKESRSLQILKEMELLNAYNSIHTDLGRLPFGLAIFEILNQVFEEGEPDEIFFNFLTELLLALSQIKSAANVLIYFLLKFMSYLGFKPSLQNCSSGDTLKCAEKVFLSMENGQVFCTNCFKSHPNPIALQKGQFFYLKNLQKSNHRRLKELEIVRPDAFVLVQKLLNYINFHLDKNIHLESLQLLSQ